MKKLITLFAVAALLAIPYSVIAENAMPVNDITVTAVEDDIYEPVLINEDPLLVTTKAVKAGNEEITNIYVKDGKLMLPLRKIAEALEFTVEWDGENKAVILNGGMYSMVIGENSYIKGRMMPIELSVAPEVTNDRTFVPIEYMTEILELETNFVLNEDETAIDVIEIR